MTTEHRFWSPLASRRVSRRRALASATTLAAGAGALAIVGCSGGGDASSTAAPAPVAGGTLRTGTSLPLSAGLDPQTELGTGLAIFPRVYGYLLHVDPRDDSVMYDHATRVEQPDANTYVFHLRPGVRFQDVEPVNGRMVTSEDVALSIERYRDNPVATSKTWHTTVLERVETPDPATVRVTTRRPNAYTLSALGAIGAGAILPKEVVEQHRDLTAYGAGSGPFRIESVGTDGIALARHEGYYRAPIPYLDGMRWTIYADDETKLDAFRQRQLDVVPNRDKHDAQALRAFSDEVSVDAQPSLAWLSLGMRVDRPPFNDARVRGAIDLALDRETLINTLTFGDGEVLGPVNPHLANGYWSLPRVEVVDGQRGTVALEERRSAARALLAAAGASSLAFNFQVAAIPQLIDVATVVRGLLRELGMSIIQQEIPLLDWFANFHTGQFAATLISHLPYESPDIAVRYYHSAGPDGTTSMFGFGDNELDQQIEASWGEMDRDARRDRLVVAQRAMAASRAMLQLFTSVGYSSAWRTVQNRQPNLVGSLAQYNYEQWLQPSS